MSITSNLKTHIARATGKYFNYFTSNPYKFLSNDYNNPVDMDIYTVAFNNEKTIEYQIKLFAKFVRGTYRFIVCDNSSNNGIAQKIQNICENYNISYFRLNQHIKFSPSMSHGLALNWIYYNIVKERKNNFCFIDHDLFPIKEFNINDFMSDKFYGLLKERENGKLWYLWPGYCFFNFKFINSYNNVSFTTCKRCDTGGQNYHVIYKNFDKNTIRFAKFEPVKILPDENIKENVDQLCTIEYIDDCWLHTIAASGWVDISDKNKLINQKLEELLNN